MVTSKEQLKAWFKRELKPKQDHFFALLDSFWHKSEIIPAEKVDALAKATTITINNVTKPLSENPTFSIQSAGSGDVVVCTIGNIKRRIGSTNEYETLQQGDYDSADDVKKTGFYKTLDNPHGTPWGVRGDFLMHFEFNDLSATQEYHSRANDNSDENEASAIPTIYFRRKAHGIWGDWYTVKLTKWVKPTV